MNMRLLIGLLVLTGCTTVGDFKKMSADQRAVAVCRGQQNIKALIAQKKVTQESISDAQNALARGYRVHTQCRQVKVYGASTTTCSTFGGYTTCNESRPESYETRCTETPVSINPDQEKSNIRSWSQSLDPLEKRINGEWQECYQFIYKLSPEDAFKHY